MSGTEASEVEKAAAAFMQGFANMGKEFDESVEHHIEKNYKTAIEAWEKKGQNRYFLDEMVNPIESRPKPLSYLEAARQLMKDRVSTALEEHYLEARLHMLEGNYAAAKSSHEAFLKEAQKDHPDYFANSDAKTFILKQIHALWLNELKRIKSPFHDPETTFLFILAGHLLATIFITIPMLFAGITNLGLMMGVPLLISVTLGFVASRIKCALEAKELFKNKEALFSRDYALPQEQRLKEPAVITQEKPNPLNSASLSASASADSKLEGPRHSQNNEGDPGPGHRKDSNPSP